jgi:hypothetical protein
MYPHQNKASSMCTTFCIVLRKDLSTSQDDLSMQRKQPTLHTTSSRSGANVGRGPEKGTGPKNICGMQKAELCSSPPGVDVRFCTRMCQGLRQVSRLHFDTILTALVVCIPHVIIRPLGHDKNMHSGCSKDHAGLGRAYWHHCQSAAVEALGSVASAATRRT